MELPINDEELATIVSALRLGGDAALYQKLNTIKNIREENPGGPYKKIAREQFGFVLQVNFSVYDDAVPYNVQNGIMDFSAHSKLRLGWKDHDFHELGDVNLFSEWSEDDLVASGLWEHMEKCIQQTTWFTNSKFSRCILNLVRPNDVHLIHSHGYDQVVLYYVNLEWRDGWYGETLFYSEDTRDVVFTSPFVPGRMILFDGNIPHAIRPQSVAAPKYRWTISTFFA